MIFSDNINPANSLIHAVHRFYPVGFNLTNDQYDGYNAVKEIVAEKIEKLKADTFPINLKLFNQKIKNHFSNLRVQFEYHKQFPSYSIVLFISERDYEGLQHILRVAIKISLLINYYTVYFEEYVKYKDIYSEIGTYNTTVVSFNRQKEENKLKINILFEFLSECFPKYFAIGHDLLFKFKVHHGTTFGNEFTTVSEGKPVFDYLFDNQFYAGLLVLD